MPYAQIEVSAPRHRKIWHLSDAAFRVWVTGLCYCQEHLTDGSIHADALVTLTPKKTIKPAVIDELVSRGLWEPDGQGGWRVHDYLTWNETREKVEARRAKWRARRNRTAPPTSPAPPPRTPERTPSTASSTHPSVPGTLRSATLRSTDQDQEHPADAGAPHRLRLETRAKSRDPGPPNPKKIAVIIQELLGDGVLTAEKLRDLPEDTKTRCAQLQVAYDSASVHQALRGVLAHASTRRRA